MCRIVGIKENRQNDNEQILVKMRDTMSYGGPDAANIYINSDEGIALGHRRLSILDLSDAGIQPKAWNDLVITFNGEVYNYEEVKKAMPEYTFETGTDTEVILKAFEKWGYDCVHRFRGMFAFAIWNKKEKKLILCRDRMGVKPLFWYQKNDCFMFASELKAFHEYPDFDKTINPEAVSLFLQQGYIPAPHSIFKYAHKLEPGHWLEIGADQQIKKIPYWNAKSIYEKTTVDKRSEEEITEHLEGLLNESFQLRMVADVPVGMFLSGGIDSSLVTALLSKQASRPVKTFTIGFQQPELNEAPHAKAISEYLGTDHTELYCREEDFKSVIPKLPDFYDEPFGDSSAIPTYLVAKMAREQVTVSLSADGGDELFGGYTKYEIAQNYFSKIDKIPAGIRKGMGKIAGIVDPVWLDNNKQYIPVLNKYKDIQNKFSKFRNALSAEDLVDFFNISSSYITPKQLESFLPIHQNRFVSNGTKSKDDLMLGFLGMIDMKTYLEGDIMTKVDRATMQVALEGREPFLDHHLVEFALGLPDNLKIRGNSTKYILRKILYKHVPKELIERPKQGFSIPIRDWLLNLLAPDLKAMLNDTNFFECFQLNRSEVQAEVNAFFEETRFVNPHFIWFFYTLHRWYLRWMV